MKRKLVLLFTGASIIGFFVLMAIVFSSCNDSQKEVKNGPVDLKVKKVTLITKKLHPKFFRKGINYDRIHKKYPKAQLILAAGFKPDMDVIVPLGLCAEKGHILNENVAYSTGMLLLDRKGRVTIEHGASLKDSPMLKSVFLKNSVIQLQSLVRDGSESSFKNDQKEDHFVLIQDEDQQIFVWSYEDQKLSDVISDLKNRHVRRALKLGGGSANGGIFFSPLKKELMLGQDLLKSSTIVAILAFEVDSVE